MGTDQAGNRQRDILEAEAVLGDPFSAAVRATRMPMIVTDPRQFDNPIVFANDAFLQLTGYTRLEVAGRNCRFLQGPDTDPAAVDRIRSAVRDEVDIKIDILNYRKDGSTFHNALYVGPVRDEQGRVVYFFASQLDVSEHHRLESEIAALKVRLAAAEAKLAAQGL
ncbi:PAS domain-containing protein [Methylobacterium sp. J-076]|uniref:PAS domain-containing protein n=1 Tax=Methylobacterium sp. J-076 TaxID=2836655 RepID=UPI002444A26A